MKIIMNKTKLNYEVVIICIPNSKCRNPVVDQLLTLEKTQNMVIQLIKLLLKKI